jgi:hypothetical protein
MLESAATDGAESPGAPVPDNNIAAHSESPEVSRTPMGGPPQPLDLRTLVSHRDFLPADTPLEEAHKFFSSHDLEFVAVLGLFEQSAYHPCQTALQPGDRLLLYTDGIYEVFNGDKEFGMAGFIATLRRCSDLPIPQLLDRLLDTARAFGETGSFEDDVCLLAIETAPAKPE